MLPSRLSLRAMNPSELPAHIGLIEQRRLKKLARAQAELNKPKNVTELLERPWLTIQDTPAQGMSVKLMTWNVSVKMPRFTTSDNSQLLAQCLVRKFHHPLPSSTRLIAHRTRTVPY